MAMSRNDTILVSVSDDAKPKWFLSDDQLIDVN